MSASHAMIEPDVEQITRLAGLVPAIEIVETTNKRMILRTQRYLDARTFADYVHEYGYYSQIRRGLKSNWMYIQVCY